MKDGVITVARSKRDLGYKVLPTKDEQRAWLVRPAVSVRGARASVAHGGQQRSIGAVGVPMGPTRAYVRIPGAMSLLLTIQFPDGQIIERECKGGVVGTADVTKFARKVNQAAAE
jgi:hypothetical protein